MPADTVSGSGGAEVSGNNASRYSVWFRWGRGKWLDSRLTMAGITTLMATLSHVCMCCILASSDGSLILCAGCFQN